MIYSLTEVNAVDIQDAWFQCIYKLMDTGFRYIVERGSFEGQTRFEFDNIIVFIANAYMYPYDKMLPQVPHTLGFPNPVENGYIEQYLPYLMTDYIAEGEQYTYGSRIYKQISYWIEVLKTTPNTNQAVLQVAQPNDYNLSDPPCLRHIDMRIRDNQLIFYPYFRSWDLWGGFPANLAAIAVLQKDMADRIGIDTGPIWAGSKGLHIYGYAEEFAKLRVGR
uniref:Putative thymidylate synthase n=1 Tax=viral metagenome TaxID=1070528 RepID=A0A6M3LE58_9ZZZZ